MMAARALVPQAQPVAGACRYGDDVLERPPHLHAHHVVAGVDAEGRRVQGLLHRERGGRVPRRRDHVGRQAVGHLAREARPREEGQALRADLGQSLAEHGGEQLQRGLLDALGGYDDDGGGADVRRGLPGELAQMLGGRGEDDQVRAAHGFAQIAAGAQRVRELHAGKEGRVLVARRDGVYDLALERPEPHRVAQTRRVAGQGRAPGARPDDRDGPHSGRAVAAAISPSGRPGRAAAPR